MTKSILAILAVCMIAMVPTGAMAEHKEINEQPSEGRADCESDQDWIGYRTTRPVTEFISSDDPEKGMGIKTVKACEGEHWDGEDTVRDDSTGREGVSCQKSDINDPNNMFIGSCLNKDPNDGAPAMAPAGNPLGVRFSFVNGDGATQAYIGLDIYGVGKAVVYQGYCDGSGAGLEGQDCAATGQARTGTYIQDNSNQLLGPNNNALANVVSAAGVTKGYVKEDDCSQATYEHGTEDPDPETARGHCGRDNTAITVETLLP